jgi:predicted pyridoxine 5'-phosphate oxidase superfamily flavin-nucleotide-binding protein
MTGGGSLMVKLTDEIKESLAGTKIVFLATSSKDCTPNAVPIGAFRLLDDGTLLISDQFFNKTLQNMNENPKVAISWWGEKGGFQVKGLASIHTNDEVFRRDVAWMKEFKPHLAPKSAVLMKFTDVYHVKPGADAGKKIL